MRYIILLAFGLFLQCPASIAGDSFNHQFITQRAPGHISFDRRESKVKVYIEGDHLDMDYLRRNMRFSDFVNDPAVADVHIIVTRRTSGSGGKVYTLRYTNLTFDNIGEFTLTATTAASDTYEEQRSKLKETLTLGLMPFVNQTEAAANISLTFNDSPTENPLSPPIDPWNNWTFRSDISGSADLEESKKNFNYFFHVRADKVTEVWKFRNSAYRSVKTRKYSSGDEDYKSNNSSSSFSSSVVRSLTPRWSAGAFASYRNSNYRNTRYSISFKPAIEYNIFPWDISDRKVFTIAYYIGPEWKKYYEVSIYDKIKESLWEQSLRLNVQIVQTWGEIEAGLNATNYMHDWSKNRITFDSDLSIRIVRGLSLNMGLRVENVHDQIYLPKGDVSLEDILLNKIQLPSSFEIGANMGIRVQFGSIYNNVVNNRL